MEGQAIQKAQILSDISQQTVYLMGSSFVLGSMVTLLLLLILDWIRRDKNDK
jgi:hypothetical protein